MQSNAASQHRPVGDRPGHRFSIRNLLFFTAGIGSWCALYQRLPHLAILVSGMVFAGIATSLWVRAWRRPRANVSRKASLALTVIAWSYLYVVSIGPAIMLFGEYEDRRDMMAIYAPVGLLHATTPLEQPLEKYAERWRQMRRDG